MTTLVNPAGDIRSSLHHQGADACVQAHLLQVDGSIGEDDSATFEIHLTEQDDGGQRQLLNRKTSRLRSSLLTW